LNDSDPYKFTEKKMVTVGISEGMLVIDVQGLDKLWSLRSTLRIPLTHITGAEIEAGPALGWFDGLRLAGTFLPGVLSAGTFYHRDGLVFWDVHDRANAIRIMLEHETYKELVVEVADPADAVKRITAAIKH
jgi:hypothetical protein